MRAAGSDCLGRDCFDADTRKRRQQCFLECGHEPDRNLILVELGGKIVRAAVRASNRARSAGFLSRLVARLARGSILREAPNDGHFAGVASSFRCPYPADAPVGRGGRGSLLIAASWLGDRAGSGLHSRLAEVPATCALPVECRSC